MSIDLSVYSNQKTLADYANARQDRADQAQQLYQQGQAQNLDLLSKKNIYATQVLSAVSASGDQNAYNMGLQHLKQAGIDTSAWAPDVQTGAQQAQQARLAQSPLGSLLNAGLKGEANNIAAANAATNPAGAAALDPLSRGVATQLAGLMGGSRPQVQQGAAVSVGGYPVPQPNSGLPPDQIQPTQTSSPPPLSPPPEALTGLGANLQAPRAQDYGTMNQYKAAQDAFEQRPDVIQAKKIAEAKGTKAGEHLGEAGKTLDIMQSNLPSVLQRFQTMREASTNASSGMGVNNEGDGFAQQWANTSMGNDKTSQANNVLEQRAAQGILPELGPQLAQAGVKGNKFLETIANSASGLNMSAKPQDKVALIDGLESTYINNLKATAAQLRAGGQQAPTDQEIDEAVKKIKASAPQDAASAGGWSVKRVK